MAKVLDQAYVLDSKAYKESSALIKFFSLRSGVCSGILRQVYQKNENAQQRRSLLQFGNELTIEYPDRGELKTIYHIDSLSSLSPLNTKQYVLISYLNELLTALLPQNMPQAHLFDVYQNTLLALEHKPDDERSLRYFEFHLLNEMGFSFDWLHEHNDGRAIQENSMYHFDAHHGFSSLLDEDAHLVSGFLGEDILAISQADFSNQKYLQVAKRIFRRLIQVHLGSRKLKTRQLYLELFA